MQKRIVLNSRHLEELRKKKLKILRNRILFFVVSFLIIIGGSAGISHIPKLLIKSVEVRGVKILDADVLQGEVEGTFKSKYNIFSKYNVFIYPKSKISRILAQIPRIKTFDISLENFNHLVVNISERENKYIWCGDEMPADNASLKNTDCYFMDENGYVMEQAPYFSGDVYFRFFGKINGDSENPSSNYFLPNIFGKISLFKTNLEKMGLKLSSFSAKENGDMEMRLSSGSTILFKGDADFDKLTENLQAALVTEPDLINKSVDLRFGNKVYFLK
ncbi:MAG: hypothetical protein V4439_02805 [Patescibacteria group bacterium]